MSVAWRTCSTVSGGMMPGMGVRFTRYSTRTLRKERLERASFVLVAGRGSRRTPCDGAFRDRTVARSATATIGIHHLGSILDSGLPRAFPGAKALAVRR